MERSSLIPLILAGNTSLVFSCTFGGLSLVLFSGLVEAVAPFS